MVAKVVNCTRVVKTESGPTARAKPVRVVCGAPAIARAIEVPYLSEDKGYRCADHVPPLETPRWHAEREVEHMTWRVDAAQRSYREQMQRIQDSLSRATARVAGLAEDRPESYSKGRLGIAGAVQREVLGMVSNLGLEYLAEYAVALSDAERDLAAAQAALDTLAD